jgi:hypothetical protein
MAIRNTVPVEEYLGSIAFNMAGLLSVLVFFPHNVPALVVACTGIIIDAVFLCDFVANRKKRIPTFYAGQLSRLYFPLEMVESGLILHFMIPHLLFPIQAIWAMIILFYNNFRIRSQGLTVSISVFTGIALVYAQIFPQSGIEKFIALFVGLAIAVIAEVQRRIIRDISAENHNELEKVRDTFLTEIESTQREVIFKLSEIAECRSKETGNHVRRVAEYSKILALGCGLGDAEAELLMTVTPMHDIGKLGIPESILAKPGALTPEERAFMQQHPVIGHTMLVSSKRKVFKSAAIVSIEHHEKFDGTGYPHGKKGNEIHMYGRIAAIADVFDALASDRCYKKAWPMEKVVDLLNAEKGRHFDPHLVDIFLSNFDQIKKIHGTFAG